MTISHDCYVTINFRELRATGWPPWESVDSEGSPKDDVGVMEDVVFSWQKWMVVRAIVSPTQY